jgi:hypothetical protein
MRRLLNILAVILVGFNAVVVAGCLVVIGAVIVAFVHKTPALVDSWPGVAIAAFAAGMAFICSLFGWRALAHLRKPDADTAFDIITLALYLLAFIAVFPLSLGRPYVAILLLSGLSPFSSYLIKRIELRSSASPEVRHP